MGLEGDGDVLAALQRGQTALPLGRRVAREGLQGPPAVCHHHRVVLGTGGLLKYHPGGVGEAVDLNVRQERHARDWSVTKDG